MKHVLFARHGQAASNVQGLLARSRANSDLTELGPQRAHESATRLFGEGVDLIVSSPLLRTYKTAEIIAADIGYGGKIVTERLFIERRRTRVYARIES